MRKHTFLYILFHIIGCLFFLTLPVITSPDFPGVQSVLRKAPTQRDFIGYALMICFFYFNFFFLIPRFYFARRFGLFYGIVFLCFLAVAGVPQLVLPENNFPEFQPGNKMMHRPPPPRDFNHDNPSFPHNNGQTLPPPLPNNTNHPMQANNYLFTLARYLFIFLALVFFSLILRVNNRLKLVEKERLKTELLYLKAQINPHFLFNSLNTIYSLAVVKADDTAAAVIRLSEMMRYVINVTGKEEVMLQEEINYINNYVALQQLRFGDLVEVHATENTDAAGKKIAPLILIPFIENAFKYGVSGQEKSDIYIDIAAREGRLYLSVKNKKANMQPVESSGIGLANTQSRLALLYPAKHTLVIESNEDFSVSLSLDLS